MDVSVAGMSKAGDGEFVFLLELCREAEEVLKAATRDDDVFVEFGQAGIAEGIGEFTPDLPDGLGLMTAESGFDKQRMVSPNDAFEVADFGVDGFLLSIEFDNQMRTASPKALALGAFVSGGEGK